MDVKDVSSDEIDLLELFQVIWDGKWKILLITLLSGLGMFGFQYTQPTPNFTATTEIRPIGPVEAEYYEAFNALDVFEITPELLSDLYFSELLERESFLEAIRTLELFDETDFDTAEDYEDVIRKFAISIEIIEPTINIDGQLKDSKSLGKILHEFNDEQKWSQVLEVVNQDVNEAVRNALLTRFEIALENIKQKKAFKLAELNLEIDGAFSNYDRETANRLSFLREQAAIAREIGIQNNSIQSQVYETQAGPVTNFSADSPFYLRGYKSIEKEIALIESRASKAPFIDNLLALERERQKIEQDITVEKARILFQLTPIIDPEGFSAMSMGVANTQFTYKNNNRLLLALSLLIGGFAGSVIILLSHAMRSRQAKLG